MMRQGVIRRFAGALAILIGLACGASAEPGADNRNMAPLRIAIVMLGASADDAAIVRAMTGAVAANLGRGGQMIVLNEAQFVEAITDIDRAPRFADWRAIDADALVTARISSEPG